jgi:hypothetical protein
MSEREPSAGEPEESDSLPPDYDAPGQVDYPDPAFDEETDEADIETPDEGEPEPNEDNADEDDDEDEDEEEN